MWLYKNIFGKISFQLFYFCVISLNVCHQIISQLYCVVEARLTGQKVHWRIWNRTLKKSVWNLLWFKAKQQPDFHWFTNRSWTQFFLFSTSKSCRCLILIRDNLKEEISQGKQRMGGWWTVENVLEL